MNRDEQMLRAGVRPTIPPEEPRTPIVRLRTVILYLAMVLAIGLLFASVGLN